MTYLGKNVTVRKSTYSNNGNLAVILLIDTPDDECAGYDYSVVTVNLVQLPDPDMAFLDINNYPSIVSFIEDNKLGYSLGYTVRSGFVEYPLYQFDLSKIPEDKL